MIITSHFTTQNYKLILVIARVCGVLLTTNYIVNNTYTFTQTKYDTH